MAKKTYKLTTLVGESDQGLEDAVRVALATSGQKVHGQTWAQVTDIRLALGDGGDIEQWQATVEVAFAVDQ